jgi:glycogen debranching enzyme
MDVERLLANELERCSVFLDGFYGSRKQFHAVDWLRWVALSTDSFVVRNTNDEGSIVAGYFWFESWGRDTFISLPGLLLVTGRFEDAKHVLLNYNTVDGTLWYVNAVLQYLKYTGDFGFVQQELWEKLKSIIENHEKGTEYDIHLNSDGLLAHGSRLTWMDACIEGEAVTPRAGKAVEIQALWYNALRIMELLATKFGDKGLAEKYAVMAQQASKSFNEKFWNGEKNCLFDVVEENGVDRFLWILRCWRMIRTEKLLISFNVSF